MGAESQPQASYPHGGDKRRFVSRHNDSELGRALQDISAPETEGRPIYERRSTFNDLRAAATGATGSGRSGEQTISALRAIRIGSIRSI